MKRIVAFLLALVMALTMTTLTWAEGEPIGATGPTSGTCGAESNEGGRDSVKWEVTPNGGKVAKEDEDGNTVLLPAYTLTISGKGEIMGRIWADKKGNTWLTKDENGKSYHDQITVADIQEGVTGIGNDDSLDFAVVNIPASVTKIGEHNFSPETTMNLAEGNKSFVLENGALLTSDRTSMVRYMPGSMSVDSYTVPSTVKNLLGGALRHLQFNTLDLGTVESVGQYALGITVDELVLPDTLTKSAAYPFFGSNIRKIVIGSGMTEIPSNFFGAANFLQEIVIGANVTKINYRGCSGLSELRKVTFAENSKLEKIEGAQAFSGCPKLESIELPDSCTFVDGYTFPGCSSLRTIVARGIKTQDDFKCINDKESDFYKATVSYSAALRGNCAHSNHGIGMAEYYVNGTKAAPLGWYKEDGTCTRNGAYDIAKLNNVPTTVYAVYMTDCAMDANGGTGTMGSVHSYVAPGLGDEAAINRIDKEWKNAWNFNENTKAPACTFTAPTGYAFMGWNTEADGSGDSYNVGDYLKTTNQPLTKLYAQWGKRAEDGTVYTVSCDTSLVYTGTSQTPSVTMKMTKDSDTTTLTAGTYRVQADTDCSAGLHKGTVYLVENDADTGVTIDFNYEIKKAPCVLTVDQDSVSVKGKGTVTLNVSGGTVVTMADGDLKGSFADGVYTATAPDSTKKYTVTFTDAGDANHEGGTKSVTVYVTARSSANLSLSGTAKTVKAGVADSVSYTYNGDGAVTATSSDETVAKVTVDAAKKIISITPLKDGTADIVVTGAATTNYKATAAVLVLTVEKRDVSLTLNNSTWTVKAGVANSVRYTYDGDGAVTAASSDETVAKVTVDAEKKLIDITPLKAGKVDITVSAAATDTCKVASAKLELTVTTAAVIKSDTETKEIDAGAAKELIVNVPDINGKPAKVVFNKAAADYLRGLGADLDLSLKTVTVPDSLKNSEQVKGKTCVMVEVTLTDASGGNVFTAPVRGAEATVEFYGATGMENVKAYFVNASGELEALAEQQYKYTSDGLIMLTLEHFSQYLVAGEEPVTPPTPTPTPSRPIRINQTKTTSPGTGDAGVAIYAVSAMLSMAGGVCLFRKKKDD